MESHQADDTSKEREAKRRKTRVLGVVERAKVTVEISEVHCSQ